MKSSKKPISIYAILLEAILLLLVICELTVFLGAIVSRFAFRTPVSLATWDEHKSWINVFVNTIESYGLFGVFWPAIFYANIIILVIITVLFIVIYKQRKEPTFPKQIVILCAMYGVFWFPAVFGMLAYSM